MQADGGPSHGRGDERTEPPAAVTEWRLVQECRTLASLFQKIRPDFDLASSGLKEAWERGDRDRFLVDTLEEPIRYTEGRSVGIKR
jgi:hypothetical protein